MSLIDELLADFEEIEAEAPSQDPSSTGELDQENELKSDELKFKEPGVHFDHVREVASLYDSEKLKHVMSEIRSRKGSIHKEVTGNLESDPEYQLIVEANNLAAEIDNEINVIFKFTKEKYFKRFPELESLVPIALDYMFTVKELGNDLDKAKNNETLLQFLTPATLMVVSVTASTTQGQNLTQEELDRIFEACDMAAELNAYKLEIYGYVESRMCFIAPNLSAIVGSSIAAKLMGVAGGLNRLACCPACNILSLGSQKMTLSGFSTSSILPHKGFIYSCEILQNTPPDLQKQIARHIANKCILAARVDASHEFPDGSFGLRMKEETEKKLDKLQEPPPVKQVKPLPAPIDQPRKKRGGRRVRKMKERYATTELRKQANRMTFAEIEEDAYQEDLGLSLGQIKKGGTGRIRAAQVDEKTKVRISKTLQKQQQVWGGSTSVRKQISGTASSVAFTPLQGLEIVNPQAVEKKADSENRYFSNTASFFKIKK